MNELFIIVALIIIYYGFNQQNHQHQYKYRNYNKKRNIKKRTYKYVNNKQIERNKLTPGLRYDILKRDKFTCQICGRNQADGIKLHVDHIKPVSKGGKTVESNLRTLCDECNLGKSAKYDPNSEYN